MRLNSASTHVDTDPTRTRKLLLNRRQLDHLIGAVERRGYTLVPLELYWKEGRAKLEIGLAKGKKQHDKRAHRQGPRLAARQGPDHEVDAALSPKWFEPAKERKLALRLGPTGFDMGCETAGAYRGAGSSLNYLQTYSCQSRQLRSSRLIAVETQTARADANVRV